MGLDLASFPIFTISHMSPTTSLYGLPWSPCSLSSLSILFGLSHNQFSTFHAHIRASSTMTFMLALLTHVASICFPCGWWGWRMQLKSVNREQRTERANIFVYIMLGINEFIFCSEEKTQSIYYKFWKKNQLLSSDDFVILFSLYLLIITLIFLFLN